MTIKLDQDQEDAVARLFEHDHTLLVAEMGAGKTAVALTAAQELMELKRDGLSRILVVGPLRPCESTWPNEAAKWPHLTLSVGVATGDPAQREKIIRGMARIVCLNFENLPWFVDTYGKTHGFDGLIVDEMTRFRVPSGAQFKALMKIRNSVEWFVGMTGTPVSEDWTGLYGQMRITDKGETLGKNKQKYLLDYFYPTDFDQHNWALRGGSDAQIASKISPSVYTMPGYTDQLPDLSVGEIDFNLPGPARDVYEKMKHDFVMSGEDVEAANAAVLVGKLQQMANGFVYTTEGKTKEIHGVRPLLAKLWVEADPSPSVIVYQFKEDLRRLRELWPDAPVMSEAKGPASRVIDDWNAGKVPVLLLHPKSAGHGINLQFGGHRMLWLSPYWSRDLWDQTIARLWRRGQTHAVDVQVIVANGTVDELILARLESKGDFHPLLLEHLNAA